MMKLKPIVFILISLTLLTSCSEKSERTITGYSLEDPLYLTMYSEDIVKEDVGFSSPVANEISRLTGVKLDIQYPVENVSEKIDLMINSGDYPDLVMIKDTNKMVDAKAYMDLTPLIEAHGPNLKKLYGDYMNRLKFSLEDSSIYVLPAKPVDEIKYKPVMGFRLQHAVVKALDYPRLETLEDFEKAIKDYIKLYPEINGQKSIGLSFLIEDWRWKITIGNSAGFVTGAPDDGNWFIDPETYEASYRFLRPEEKDYYQWLNKMYNEGLVDPDSFVQDLDAYHAKIASGRVLGLMDTNWSIDYGEQVLRSKGLDNRMYGSYPIQVDTTTKAAEFRDVGYIGGYGIGISKNCKDPVAVIKFLDFMASDEGQILRHWGIENEHYYYDEKGHRVLFEDEKKKRINNMNYASETGITVYTYPFPQWGQGKKDDLGNYYNPETFLDHAETYSDIEKQVLEAYGVKTWSELYPKSNEIPKSEWGEAWDIPIPSNSTIRKQLMDCDGIVKSGLVEVIISKPEDFDKKWDNMMEALETAGVDEMGEAFTKLVHKRIALWQKTGEK